jgi:hypothetical protein
MLGVAARYGASRGRECGDPRVQRQSEIYYELDATDYRFEGDATP